MGTIWLENELGYLVSKTAESIVISLQDSNLLKDSKKTKNVVCAKKAI